MHTGAFQQAQRTTQPVHSAQQARTCPFPGAAASHVPILSACLGVVAVAAAAAAVVHLSAVAGLSASLGERRTSVRLTDESVPVVSYGEGGGADVDE